VHLRVAIDLAGRREQESGSLELRQAERVMRSLGADLQRVQGQALAVDRARRARQVVDDVDLLIGEERLRQVVVHEEKVRAPVDVLDVLQRASVEVVDTQHAVPAGEQVVAEVGAEEAGPPVTTAVLIDVQALALELAETPH
jgi:hypothetical protein